jgi:transmembrane sensor
MSRKEFGQLLEKYLRGECTPEEKTFVEHWYGLLETNPDESGQEADLSTVESRLWNQIQQKMDAKESAVPGRVVPLRTSRYRWIGLAASLLLAGIWLFGPWQPDRFSVFNPLKNESNPDWTEQTNSSAIPLLVRLEDGSTVRLAAHSTLRFPKHFAAQNRTVYLTGDAFFAIQKLPSRPFFVHTGSVVTKVLGTSFFIRTQPASRQIRVEVVTGRVAVYDQPKENQRATREVVLTPNQTATYFTDKQTFVTGLVTTPRLIEPALDEKKQSRFLFDDAPASEVLAQLEKSYGIDIELENPELTNCPLTADLTNQPLETQLAIICAALKTTYEIQGTTILLSGKGCSQ